MGDLLQELLDLEQLQDKIIERVKKLEKRSRKSTSNKKERQMLKSLRGQLNSIKMKSRSIKTSISNLRRQMKAKLRNPNNRINFRIDRASTPLDILLTDKGVATSIWNNLRRSPDREKYLIAITKYVNIFGEKALTDVWINNYFKASYNYDSDTNNYNTDTALGIDIFKDIESDVYQFEHKDEREEELKKRFEGRIIEH